MKAFSFELRVHPSIARVNEQRTYTHRSQLFSSSLHPKRTSASRRHTQCAQSLRSRPQKLVERQDFLPLHAAPLARFPPFLLLVPPATCLARGAIRFESNKTLGTRQAVLILRATREPRATANVAACNVSHASNPPPSYFPHPRLPLTRRLGLDACR